MTRPFFTRDRISDFDTFDRHAEAAIKSMKQRHRERFALDIQDLVSRFTIDSATEFLFGKCVHSLASGLPYPYSAPSALASSFDKSSVSTDAFAKAFQEAQELIANRMRSGDVWSVGEISGDKTKPAMEIVSAYLEPILTEALRRKKLQSKVDDKGSKEEIGEDETLLEHLVRFTEGEDTIHKRITGC